MNPHDIKALLGKRGVKQVHLARSLKVTSTTVNNVIFRKGRSRRVASAIARAVGLTKSELWPDIYAPKKRADAR